MAFKKKLELSSDVTFTLGGTNKAGKKDPTSVEGYYLGARPTPDKGYGPGVLHFFQTETGNVGVWGKSRLNNLLTKDLVGTMVRPVFKGMSPKMPGKNPAYLYELHVDAGNTIDVSGLDTEPTVYQDEVDEDSAEATQDDGYEETEADAEETAEDEIKTSRAKAPTRPATTPSAERQAQVQALLNRSKRA